MLTINDNHPSTINDKYVDVVNEHYKKPGIELFNDVTTYMYHHRYHWYSMSQSQTWKWMLQSDHLEGDVFENNWRVLILAN